MLLWKNLEELFGQSNICIWSSEDDGDLEENSISRNQEKFLIDRMWVYVIGYMIVSSYSPPN